MGKNKMWRLETLGFFGIIFMLSLYAAIIGGWIANIVKLIGMADISGISTMFVMRIVGVFIIPVYELMDSYLHPFLFNTGIYNFLLRKNQTILNPQYTKIILYIILLSVLGIMVIYKKTRTLDRLIMFFMGSSVLVTLILFHTAIPSGFFVLAKNQAVKEVLNQLNTVSAQEMCKNNNCFVLDKNNKSTSLTGNDYSNYKTYDWFILNAKKDLESSPSQTVAIQAVGDFSNQRFDYIIMAIKKVEINKVENFLVFADENKMKPYSRQSEIWFSFLTTAAHSIWIFGSLLLIFFHKYRFKKKLIAPIV